MEQRLRTRRVPLSYLEIFFYFYTWLRSLLPRSTMSLAARKLENETSVTDRSLNQIYEMRLFSWSIGQRKRHERRNEIALFANAFHRSAPLVLFNSFFDLLFSLTRFKIRERSNRSRYARYIVPYLSLDVGGRPNAKSMLPECPTILK